MGFLTRIRYNTSKLFRFALFAGGVRNMTDLACVIHSDPKILGGTPVFRGTRVPVKNLIDHLAAGDSLDKFLDAFPSVTREQAVAALELAGDLLAAGANSAR